MNSPVLNFSFDNTKILTLFMLLKCTNKVHEQTTLESFIPPYQKQKVYSRLISARGTGRFSERINDHIASFNNSHTYRKNALNTTDHCFFAYHKAFDSIHLESI